MADLLQYMLPLIALLVALKDGVIVWAMKISAGLGCLAGMVAIYVYRDMASGFKMLFSVFVGVYLLMYVVETIRMQRREKRKCKKS